MSSSTSTTNSPIAQLRARLQRLALDPRVRLLPDGPAIAKEWIDALAQLDELELRVLTIERRIRGLMVGQNLGCDEP